MKSKDISRIHFLKRRQLEFGVIKMKKIILSTLGLLLVLSSMSIAKSVTKAGTTAAGFLAIDVGSRGTAMGSAYVSVANDATAMYWNPAGIARLNNFEAVFSNSRWIADLTFNFAGIVFPIENVGNLGLNATFLTMAEQIERTTIASPDGTGEYFDAGSYAFGLSYARNLTERFSIGFNVKYINERMYHSTAYGFALDVGALFDTNFQGLKLGMSISNYGTKMKLDGFDTQVQHDIAPSIHGNNANINARLETNSYDLPLMFRFGISMDVLKGLYKSNFILSADALHPSDDYEYVNLGAEYILYEIFSLRAGYKELFSEDTEQGLTLGAGIRYNISGATTIFFDYSYIDFGVFSDIHMFNIGFGI